MAKDMATYYEVWASTPAVENKRFATQKEAKSYYFQQMERVPAENFIEIVMYRSGRYFKLICQQQF